MKAKTTLSDFKFKFSGYGHYRVTYTSPTTGKVWSRVTDNMSLIDCTKSADERPLQKDLEMLKKLCKQ